MKIVKSTEEFKELVVKGNVVVDFYADWCGPCRMQGPILEEIEKDMEDVSIVKVNVDDNPDLADAFQVQSIPMLIIFKDAKIVKKFVGLTPKAKIVAEIK
ncbi:MAG: thioredoxin [Acholeplasmatales bacterium]|nr:thioredoxin [Acholeplasmatales bacterium]